MADLAVSTSTIDGFFRRWESSGAAERANYSMFLNELCDLLDVPRPDPAGPDDEKNAYVFERAVPFPNPDGSTTVKRIDLYKRDCFVLEAKQGSDRVEAAEPFSLVPHRRMRRGTAVRGTGAEGPPTFWHRGNVGRPFCLLSRGILVLLAESPTDRIPDRFNRLPKPTRSCMFVRILVFRGGLGVKAVTPGGRIEVQLTMARRLSFARDRRILDGDPLKRPTAGIGT